MKIVLSFFLIILVLSVPSVTCAQGVPKAYETVAYQGKVNGRLLRLSLANGYIGASYLKLYLTVKAKPAHFQPDAGTADAYNKLKFLPVTESGSGYFTLDNMQEVYGTIPSFISGYYFSAGDKTPVRFRLIKSHQR